MTMQSYIATSSNTRITPTLRPAISTDNDAQTLDAQPITSNPHFILSTLTISGRCPLPLSAHELLATFNHDVVPQPGNDDQDTVVQRCRSMIIANPGLQIMFHRTHRSSRGYVVMSLLFCLYHLKLCEKMVMFDAGTYSKKDSLSSDSDFPKKFCWSNQGIYGATQKNFSRSNASETPIGGLYVGSRITGRCFKRATEANCKEYGRQYEQWPRRVIYKVAEEWKQ
ncbi:uncharacterized protein MELLADRAFT_113910 [Melampsora larici-populina 98AG31]|uniref:Uncharacterized protein n=1 Tax=Melampsora larici-populina (strain 98AG31 / pathotype 3-4-7) TaxID=747676 RepID=F4SBF3_MELLP|nr:uncharacterized protein MELLADRAFT_113910 [Melampsora larici-populina 98AG31]EGF98019.1 hypothetical protein MELLADRAFT_113910 [Melampsora larici-populina 98AG31]